MRFGLNKINLLGVWRSMASKQHTQVCFVRENVQCVSNYTFVKARQTRLCIVSQLEIAANTFLCSNRRFVI